MFKVLHGFIIGTTNGLLTISLIYEEDKWWKTKTWLLANKLIIVYNNYDDSLKSDIPIVSKM